MSSRVVIDARKLGDGGIGVYIENLVDGLLQIQAGKVVLILNPRQNPPTRWENKLELVFDGAKKYSFSEYFIMPLRLRSVFKNSLVHFPHYTVPFFLPRSAKVIVTIHDCIHLKNKSFFKRFFSRLMLSWAIFRAHRIITVSNYSKESILRNFSSAKKELIDVVANNISPNLKAVPTKQATCAELGSTDFGELSRVGLATSDPTGYFLFVGNGMQHKGFEIALAAFDSLRLKSKLIVAGKNFSAEQLAQASESVLFVGECEQLSNFYAKACALLMPSLEEGFGIPALEALSCGVPVVATPAPSLVEWFGDSIWFANRFDALALADAVKAMLADEKNRQRRIELGLALAKKFSVLESALKTLEVYQKAAPEFKFSEQAAQKFAKVAVNAG